MLSSNLAEVLHKTIKTKKLKVNVFLARIELITENHIIRYYNSKSQYTGRTEIIEPGNSNFDKMFVTRKLDAFEIKFLTELAPTSFLTVSDYDIYCKELIPKLIIISNRDSNMPQHKSFDYFDIMNYHISPKKIICDQPSNTTNTTKNHQIDDNLVSTEFEIEIVGKTLKVGKTRYISIDKIIEIDTNIFSDVTEIKYANLSYADDSINIKRLTPVEIKVIKELMGIYEPEEI